jgi:hypothetical protein
VKFRAVPLHPNALVWRISEGAPLGEWVKKDAPVHPKVARTFPDDSDVGFLSSSFDLLNGTDVIEDDNTIPGELFDELFGPPSKPTPK